MAVDICNGTGNLTGAATFAAAETGALATVLNRNTMESLANNASVTSATFTVTNGHVIDAVLLWIRQGAAGSTGTFKVDLQKSAVSQASVTVNRVDLPPFLAAGNAIGQLVPVLFKLGSTATGDGTANWTIVLTNSNGTNAVNYAAATASTTNFTRALRTTTAVTPAAADDLYVIGELTGAGTHTARTVTMDQTATTAYGNGSLNSTTVAGGGIHCGYYGTLSYGTTASTNYVLRINGDLWVWEQGPLNIGASGSEIPRNSSAVLEFVQASASGDFGLRVMDNAIWNAAGLSRTVGKVINKCKLNSDLSASGTTLNVDTDTGWLSGDAVCVASTTRTNTDCETLTLTGNATSSSMAVGAAVSAHSGTSPTQAEVGLITRNVKIRSTSSSLMSYVYCTALATVTVSWVEFSFVGANTTNKRGVEVDAGTATNAKSFTYCSIHDSVVINGFYANCQGGTTSLNLTFSNNIMWNNAVGGSYAFLLSSTISNGDWTFDNNLLMPKNGGGFSLGDVTGTFTNNTVVGAGSAVNGITSGGSASTTVNLGTFSGNTAHSCLSYGFLCSTPCLAGTFTNFTSWRNGAAGLNCNASNIDLTINGCTMFGNTTNNILFGIGAALTLTGTCTLSGDTTFATGNGITISATNPVVLSLSGVDMSGSGGIAAVHITNDINLTTNTWSYVLGNLSNCKFGAASPISAKATWDAKAYISIEKYNQVAGDHRTEMTYGQLKTDSTIFNSASPSMRMTPNNASSKLESAPKTKGIQVPVSNGNTAVISAYVYKSKTGDGAQYNGNQPRLIQRANPALGQNSDVVLATYGSGTGSWNQLSGNTSTATDDGAFEIIIDCDGTAGWVNVDDLQVA